MSPRAGLTTPGRWPAHLVNGVSVALGVGAIQLAVVATGGHHAAQLALAGAVCASLADVPNPPRRTAWRVSAAGLLSFVAATTVDVLAPHPVALGLAIAAIAFVAMMTMAWGLRAAAVSFAPILAIVFAMTAPPGPDELLTSIAWHAAGAVLYLAWALASAALLQPLYRRLALADAVAAVAGLLRARAALLTEVRHRSNDDRSEDDAVHAALRVWMQGEAMLADRLQRARDFVFADAEATRRDAAILLRLIELRDILLAARLDLDRVGGDDASRWLLARTAGGLVDVAQALDAAGGALRGGRRAAAAWQPVDLHPFSRYDGAPMALDDPRRRLVPSLVLRLQALGEAVDGIGALLRGAASPLPLSPAQLARFVGPEGWPLRALAQQLRGHSPVARHALRSALALGSAYFIALHLPWASHPHWLVLSVAVVLRVNLEQTLTRRNARVLGTLLGCAIVLLLARVHTPWLLTGVFLLAVGTAHAFVIQRYWLTAGAATVMALLQAHAADPAAGFAVAERVADTFLGALLAWGFSYVLPSWERRQLPDALHAALASMRDYVGHALRFPPADDAVAPRLARRRAYDALAALAGALQRSAAEPRSVQVPAQPVAAVLDHGQRLMAHVSMVRLILNRGSPLLDASATTRSLQQALDDLQSSLDPARLDAARLAAAGLDPVTGQSPAAAGPGTDPAVDLLPSEPPGDDLLPWLRRRLAGLTGDARRIGDAAATAAAAVARR